MKTLLFALLALTAASSLARDGWKAAASKVNITPEELGWMAGYAARKAPAESVLMDLHAKALALEDESGGRFVFITLDLIGVPKPLRE